MLEREEILACEKYGEDREKDDFDTFYEPTDRFDTKCSFLKTLIMFLCIHSMSVLIK